MRTTRGKTNKQKTQPVGHDALEELKEDILCGLESGDDGGQTGGQAADDGGGCLPAVNGHQVLQVVQSLVLQLLLFRLTVAHALEDACDEAECMVLHTHNET